MFGSPSDEIGKIINNRYRLDSLLGQGGMSTVYKAFDQNLKRQVAIKFIHSHLSQDAEFVGRFEQEATAVANLRHPNIYQIYDSSREGQVYYMVMEYVPGTTLEEEISRRAKEQRRFSLDETLNIMIPTCKAVHYAHEQGMIHRDLKPSNIMIDERGVPILMDFGVAKLLDQGGNAYTATGVTLGTGAYMAPEQATGGTPDPKMDIYSMGVILFELLAGEQPFYSDSVLTLMMKHINEPVPNLRLTRNHLPEIIIQIAEKALEKRPEKRYQTAEEMANDLSVLIHGSSGKIPTVTPEIEPESAPEEDGELLSTMPLPTPSDGHPIVSPPSHINDTISDPILPVMETGVMPEPVEPLAPPTQTPTGSSSKITGAIPAAGTSGRGAIYGVIGTLIVLAIAAGAYFFWPDSDANELAQTDVPATSESSADTGEPTQADESTAIPIVESAVTLPSSLNMVEIPAGNYTVGVSEPSSEQAAAQEISLDNFWIDQYETTNAAYEVYLGSIAGVEPPASWVNGEYPAGEGDHPVMGLTFEEAAAYCQAQLKQLPTEAQWEVAARGLDGRLYPWGDEANGIDLPRSGSYPIGSQAKNISPFGVYDMSGNVWEWVDSPYDSVPNGQQVLRGGQFGLIRDSAYRLIGDPNQPSIFRTAGVRCAATEVELDQEAAIANWREKNNLLGLLVSDEFTDPGSGWPEYSDEVALFGYHPPDFYHVQLSTPDAKTAAFSGADLSDFTLEVDVFVEDTETETGQFEYGIAYRRDGDQYYTFAVNPRSQMWQVQQINGEDVTVLEEGSNSSIVGGYGKPNFNQLRVDAIGDRFNLWLNGSPVTIINHAALKSGDVGFYSRTADEPFIHIHYDGLEIRQALLTTAEESVLSELSPPEEIALEEEEPDEATQTGPLPSAIGMVPIDGGIQRIGDSLQIEIESTPFWIDRFEVNNERYAEFAAATGRDLPAYWEAVNIPAEQANHAVQGLTFDDAAAYCAWVGKRLPTESEWEIAARGPHGWLYPWGDDGSLVSLPRSGTYASGTILENRSYFGVYDLAGNVWEWVDEPYEAVGEGERVMRGGANNFQHDMVFRAIGEPTNTTMFTNAGVRCAADTVSEEADIDDRTLLEDGFANIESGWWQASAPVGPYFYGYHPADFYHVQVAAADSCLSVFQPFEPDDFIAEVEVFIADTDSEDGNFQYGLTTRQVGNDFYGFAISPRAATWHIVKNSSAGVEEIGSGPIETLSGESQENRDRLAVIAKGSIFSFFVNGQLVGRANDSSFDSGDIGFYVENFDETYSHIHYDKILIQALAAEAQIDNEVPAGSGYAVISPTCTGSVVTDETLVGFVSHEVRAGEILTNIAETYGVTVEQILAANGKSIDNPDAIRPGQTIVIPQ